MEMNLTATCQGTGGNIVWIHGLGESQRCFAQAVKLLPEFSHHLIDLPSYGHAPRVQAYSLAQAAEWLVPYLEGLTSPVLVGHSMGGVIGTLLCEMSPSVVQRFVNVDGNISLGDCGYSLPVSQQSLQSFRNAGHQELLLELETLGEDDLAHAGYHFSMALADPNTVYRHSQELVSYSSQESLAGRLAALDVEHLYIAGSPDGAAPRSHTLLGEAGCQVETVEPSGHWPFIDQPEEFSSIIRRFSIL